MLEPGFWNQLTPVSFVLVGVGGQGTILASDLLAEIGLRLGYDVKKAEIHGMSQRGGSVISNLRWAPKVYSPIVPRGEADVLIAFEKLESVRFADYLAPGGLAVVNDFEIVPVTASAGSSVYPSNDEISTGLGRFCGKQVWVDGAQLAETIGNVRTSNVVVLGALAHLLELPEKVVLEAMEIRVPGKFLEVNRLAFQAGWNSLT